jgi:hypothetical protein
MEFLSLTLLYFCKEGVFNGGAEKGMDKLVSRNFSDNSPPITVPYLHLLIIQGMLNCTADNVNSLSKPKG